MLYFLWKLLLLAYAAVKSAMAEWAYQVTSAGDPPDPFERPLLLDKLAEALYTVNGCRDIATSLDLGSQFRGGVDPFRWSRLEELLQCPLPGLILQEDDWEFPQGWTTVNDLAAYVSRWRPDWRLDGTATLTQWRESQIFMGVRECIEECLCIPLDKIKRTDRFVEDLGAC